MQTFLCVQVVPKRAGVVAGRDSDAKLASNLDDRAHFRVFAVCWNGRIYQFLIDVRHAQHHHNIQERVLWNIAHL